MTRGGDAAIKRWIDEQMEGRTCAVVLVGTNTAGRKWINYEIRQAWANGMGVVGIHVHRLKDVNGDQALKGANPFEAVRMGHIIPLHDPPYRDSKDVYAHIAENIEDWIEDAIQIRAAN